MKLHADPASRQTINGYGTGWIAVNGQRYTHSLLVSAQGLCQAWPVSRFDDLGQADFVTLADLQPELVLFGSGQRLRFPPPAWLQTLMHQRIGLETMDTFAACRTYNILAGEGRRVLAALLLEPVL